MQVVLSIKMILISNKLLIKQINKSMNQVLINNNNHNNHNNSNKFEKFEKFYNNLCKFLLLTILIKD
jgi:hypothetical protein